jgi:CspA family cold shock protein
LPGRKALITRALIRRSTSNEELLIGMVNGTVKFFNAEKGYGFIARDEDVFVHLSQIEGEGYKTLQQGQAVEFEIGPGRKGDEARSVRVV